MNQLYRLLLIRFRYLGARCDFPIIIKWGPSLEAQYEVEFINKVLEQLENSLGVENVQIINNYVGTYQNLNPAFQGMIGSINHQTPTSQIRGLKVDVKKFVELTEEDINAGYVEKFELFHANFPVRVIDHSQLVLDEIEILPLIVIEE